ncbi:MAG: lipoprotein [Nitrospirales bacterium]|nr:MAG: lipoprotein [Nitrospirales bacterium]
MWPGYGLYGVDGIYSTPFDLEKIEDTVIHTVSQIQRLSVLLCVLVAFSGCAHKIEPLHFSGFLTDYTSLRPSPDDSGAWSYRKPGVNFKGYTHIILDPLVIWPSQHSEYGGVDTLTAWKLALAFHESMSRALAGGYVIVEDPGPGVLRLRAALTDVLLERPAVSTPDQILPLANDLLIRASEKISGMNALEGEAAIEIEILDTQSQERLVAYVEKRMSPEILLTQDKDSLGPVLEIFDYWGKKLRQRLDEERGLREYRKDIQ